MKYPIYDALGLVAERTFDNTKLHKQSLRQRRDQVVDIYGSEFTREADGGAPAQFYVSVSPDLIYYHRFQFKLIIQPFMSTVSGGTQSVIVNVNDTSLTTDGSTISPDPHKHTTDPHTHNVVAGVTVVQTTANDFVCTVDGVNITPYLMAQYGGSWINGQGVYPSIAIDHDYDLLEVASDLISEGRTAEANLLLHPGYKLFQISSSQPFTATLVLYLKYSHLGR